MRSLQVHLLHLLLNKSFKPLLQIFLILKLYIYNLHLY
ncbi:Rrf2 family transcriptional regulator, partial [Listeria monocytogenes]|nr:Rrf2 family transcriptional regulator [Listeria monocytogenes]EAG4874866.1 Rrf2 family transcriptional regulator [Listeria monocytogenes]EAK9090412.1 Rrf2 family transcriptional regulator [Listeria monocytogenes]EAO7416520.1 Rrf2 family transcriptional regulator [Listeria monocytogenes]